jgi:UDP-N-acetylmuramyl pentapeptide phosphotransferase/UDP-N-acetylglucosamine-1-phosphate transferase
MFCVTASVCVILVLSKSVHIKIASKGHSGSEIQSVHKNPTTRLGSLGILAAYLFLLIFWKHEESQIFYFLIGSMIFLFLAGLVDDLKFSISPRIRLFAVALSSLCMIYFSDLWLINVNTPILEPILKISFIAILFTIFAVTGVAHSINVIDGLNGLSLSIIITVAFALGMMAQVVGDTFLVLMNIFVIIVAVAILFFNFPFGKIFIGDAGAYSFGYILAWNAILIIHRNPEVSAWSVLLCFFWPVMETLYSIYRRLRDRKQIYQADNKHFHHLILKVVDKSKYLNGNIHFTNPIATILILPFHLVPSLLAIFLIFNSELALCSLLTMIISYIFSYKLILNKFTV